MRATRSPAQTEASRRDRARSRRPVIEPGKVRASRNGLKHGFPDMHHQVQEVECPSELEELTAHLHFPSRVRKCKTNPSCNT